MSWPLASHFSTMLQTPNVAFRDARLKRSVVDKDARNQPRPWAGAFAVVYKAVDPQCNEPVALRVFTSESSERRERYELISDYLKDRKLKSLVKFEYCDKSIRSAGDGKWYPLIVMEWVQGETLFKWVRHRSLAGDAAAIGRLADRWVEVVRELEENGVAHGDLQHANVMVTDSGDLKFVDYDCMCVPALVGRRNLEVGVEPYQHPSRDEQTLLSLDLDHFSSLMIYVGLRALALQPQLWQKYVELPAYDKLLFRKEDFSNPENSPLYRDLMQLPDTELRDLAGQLFAVTRVPINQVPPLGQLANSYAKIEALLVHQQWEAAVQLLNRRGDLRDAPHHLKLLIHHAYENVCRQQAWAVFQRTLGEVSEASDRGMVGAWNEKLFTGFDLAEQQRTRLADARRRVAALDRVRRLARDGAENLTIAGEKAIVDAAADLPEGYRHRLAPRVEEARRRTGAMAKFESAVQASRSEAAIVAAWNSLGEVGCQQLLAAVRRQRVELAQRRLPLLKTLAGITPDLPAADRDRRLLQAWNDDLLKGCREAQALRPAWQEAEARKQVLARLQAALTSKDARTLASLMKDPCLAGYPLPPAWAKEASKICRRVERLDSLLAMLGEDRRDGFREQFDARLIRQCADIFAPYRERLGAWTAAEVRALDAIGLRPALGRASLVPVEEAEGNYRVRWTWPGMRFAEQCLLGVCRDEPGRDEDPEQMQLLQRVMLDGKSWENAGSSWLLAAGPDCHGAHVVVWAIVDLGFQRFHSRPLILGRLETRSRWHWKNWSPFGGRPQGSASTKEDEPA